MVGLDSPKTMKFIGVIEGKQVLILLDSRATHNFISDRVVHELQIPIQLATFAVVLGDSRKVTGVGKCRGVELTIQRVQIVQAFLPFRLGVVDVILGIDWLSRLGEVKTNWGKQTMRFEWNGQKVELRGDVSLSRLESSVKTLLKLLTQGDEGLCLCAEGEIERATTDGGDTLIELVLLLREFEDLFTEPHSLPPKRDRDHTIRLVE